MFVSEYHAAVPTKTRRKSTTGDEVVLEDIRDSTTDQERRPWISRCQEIDTPAASAVGGQRRTASVGTTCDARTVSIFIFCSTVLGLIRLCATHMW